MMAFRPCSAGACAISDGGDSLFDQICNRERAALENVHLGVSAWDPDSLQRNVNLLLATPAFHVQAD
jgi:hypothetical protein